MVTPEREDEVWNNYLADLLKRINPNNLSSSRDLAAEKFAELSYLASKTMENGVITDNALTVPPDVQEKMRSEIVDNIDKCESIADVEALFFGTQIKNLGNPYGKYYDSFISWEDSSATLPASEKAKLMRSSEWYRSLKACSFSARK